MRSQPIFRGAATALITPTNEKGIDFPKFEALIRWQIESGIHALVICGTTGEASTLSVQEHRAALEFAVKIAGGRLPLIAGVGSNNTAHAIEMAEFACAVGYDALLVVTPYYNKATQKGLVQMYCAIADRSSKPIIVYNVPSRTGVNIEPSTYVELAKHPRIAAIKEAGGNLSKIVETFALVGDKLDIYSGNDDQITPILSLGGQGVISVLSNVLPAQTAELCRRFFAGDLAAATAMQLRLLPLIGALFCEPNPIPVKAALSAMGYCENFLRLPLTVLEEAHREKLLGLLREQGVALCAQCLE